MIDVTVVWAVVAGALAVVALAVVCGPGWHMMSLGTFPLEPRSRQPLDMGASRCRTRSTR